MTSIEGVAGGVDPETSSRAGDPREGSAPAWIVWSGVGLAILLFFMAVAETTLIGHFLVDRGESISVAGLFGLAGAGMYLRRRRRLRASLPFAIPWLLYPPITQGDQIIDHLDIGAMRLVAHLILLALFAAPVLALVLAAARSQPSERSAAWTSWVPGLNWIRAGQVREGATLLTSFLLLVEVWVAHRYLGDIMVGALIGCGIPTLAAMSLARVKPSSRTPGSGERSALFFLLAGCVVSASVFAYYRSLPGAYQGSPHSYHDPSRRDARFDLTATPVAKERQGRLDDATANEVQRTLAGFSLAFNDLVGAYHALDRGYNRAFHNALFLRRDPLPGDFRERALNQAARAAERAREAGALASLLADRIGEGQPLTSLLRDLSSYGEYSFRRAAMLEELTATFEKTEAGLQHATHIYEGEGKIFGEVLARLAEKHAVLSASPVGSLVDPFFNDCRGIRDAYRNRIVGF